MVAKLFTEETISCDEVVHSSKKNPRVILVANRDIPAFTELKYDYGEYDAEVLNTPGMEWLSNS